jgi:hypothetical protein
VSVFRPAVRVSAPGGEQWEVYAYRFRLPERPSRNESGRRDEVVQARRSGQPTVAVALLDILDRIAARVPRFLVQALWDVPRAAVAALRSDEWTIEAVTWLPRRTSYTWTTTREHRDHVLAQVEGQLARGEAPPRPRKAVYRGARG